jgi:hypothetical protein
VPGSWADLGASVPWYRSHHLGARRRRGPPRRRRSHLRRVQRQPPQAAVSLRRLASLDATIACFGHGEPLTHDAAAELQAADRHLPAGTGQAARDTPGISG